jgi:predicted PurR-regulated permease PerM
LSSFIMSAIIILLLLAPFAFFAYAAFKQVLYLFQSGTLLGWANIVSGWVGGSFLNGYLPAMAEEGVKSIASVTSNFILSIPSMFLNFLVLMFSLFYFFLTGEGIVSKIKELIPLKNKNQIISNLRETMNALVLGYFVIGLIGFIIAAVTFSLMGMPGALIWATVVGVLVLIPAVGSTILYIPMTLIFIIMGNYQWAIIVFVMGVVLSCIETFGRPALIGRKANINPILVLIGILGGVAVFGFVGLLIGPVVLTTTIALLEGFTEK